LDERRVLYLEAPSPIPPELRPIIYSPQANMALEGQEEGLPRLAEFLKATAERHKGKGMVHATYALAEKLRPLLEDCPRFLFHDSRSKMAVYQGWRESSEAGILVGCGLSEGIDLYGQEYEFQVLAKIPYPSLEEPAMRYLAEVKPERYAWMTLRTVAQATGRICRGADDFGVTYIVDSQWENLWKNSMRYGIVPEWLREGLAAGVQENT
jgi:Rad3-related DNA helicase